LITEITIDFQEDWLALIKSNLLLDKYTIDKLSNKQICLFYFMIEHKKINQVSRKVFYSKEFCYPFEDKDKLNAIKEIEESIANGDDLSVYQSKSVMEYKNDMLLNDWGIHHFHLGKNYSDCFVNRTGDLLYVFFDEINAYFIDIKPHDFSNIDLLNIMTCNWSNLVNENVINREVAEYEELSKEDIMKLRKAGIMTPQYSNGKMILSPGGGYASDGTSWEVHDKCHRMLKILGNNESEIRKKFANIPFKISKLIFILKVDNFGRYYVYEKNNDYRLELISDHNY